MFHFIYPSLNSSFKNESSSSVWKSIFLMSQIFIPTTESHPYHINKWEFTVQTRAGGTTLSYPGSILRCDSYFYLSLLWSLSQQLSPFHHHTHSAVTLFPWLRRWKQALCLHILSPLPSLPLNLPPTWSLLPGSLRSSHFLRLPFFSSLSRSHLTYCIFSHLFSFYC